MALVDSGPVTALIILGAVIVVQQVEGHILQPLIMGRAVAIHPLAVIIGIAAGVVLAGIIGALVAVPLIAVLNTGVRRLAARRVPDTPPDAVVVAALEAGPDPQPRGSGAGEALQGAAGHLGAGRVPERRQ